MAAKVKLSEIEGKILDGLRKGLRYRHVAERLNTAAKTVRPK